MARASTAAQAETHEEERQMTEPLDSIRPALLGRRQFLKGAMGVTAGVALAGCSSKSGRGTTGTTAVARTTVPAAAVAVPGSRPRPDLPAGIDTLPHVEHIVVVMMENHSFDNYLGMLGRGDGFTLDATGRPTASNADQAGGVVHAFRMPTTCQLPRKPSTAWTASHTQWNQGRNDGFVRSDSGPVAMGYWTGDDLPFYYGLARTFPLADRWFAPCLTETYPNRRFLMAGTAFGWVDHETPTIKDPMPPNGTIFDRLNTHGISWKNYYSSLPQVGLFLPVLAANTSRIAKIDQYFADAAAGTLPAFSLVDPDFITGSEENPQDIRRGEAFAARVINAAMHGAAWPKTLLVWLYDEHGGYYDHVPPPAAVPPDHVAPNLKPTDIPGGYDRYGFRVPAVVVSPYARKDYVSHVVHDHTSVLKLVETKWNLPALTYRDANADNLLDFVDFESPPAFLTPPSLPPPGDTTGVSTCASTGPGQIPPPGALT
jgi:phospholipase C